ncbi:MAG TPA: 23S rRNA (guanosine(2251)-2'-O)-methyltransferase RlmB [Candidatus Dormibacteraeota bacterium]|nr:23S rRNA (guanosine(2251)-2'-O)-methyltransferase RlmB [Candidatus Dormibacteraeota bacterium]
MPGPRRGPWQGARRFPGPSDRPRQGDAWRGAERSDAPWRSTIGQPPPAPASRGPWRERRYDQPPIPRQPRSGIGGLPVPEELGDDEELIAGRRPVEEAFVAQRPAVRLLVTPARREALERIVLHATRLRIPIVEVEGGTLTALAGFDGHQGVALVVEPRRFATPDEILARAAERGEPPLVLVIDSLEDPQNLGTLLRSADGAGVHGVIFPTHRQAPLTPSAVKASAGAVEHLLLAPVDDLAGTLSDLHIRGLRVVGSDAEAPLTVRQADLRGPLALVVGSEGRGMGPAIRRRTDLLVRIPMRGAVGSLNAAVAGSIVLFEAVSQRDPEGRSAPPRAASPDDTAVEAAPVPRREPSRDAEPSGDAAPSGDAEPSEAEASAAEAPEPARGVSERSTKPEADARDVPSAATPRPSRRSSTRVKTGRDTAPMPRDGSPADDATVSAPRAADGLLPGDPDLPAGTDVSSEPDPPSDAT